MTKGLILAALLLGLARVAGAQPVRDALASSSNEAVVADALVVDSAAPSARAHVDLSEIGGLLKQVAGERALRRWLDPASFRPASARFAARANPGLPGTGPKVNRTFLPIPMLGWQRDSSLLTPHGLMAISPSVVIGRRLTWAPDLGRGGRTIGVGVQVRMWLDRPPSLADARAPSQAPATILSTVGAMLGRNGG